MFEYRSGRATATIGLCLALCLPAAAQQIGTVASSEPTLRGTPPGASTRTLSVGTGVVANETVSSSSEGRGQLLFLDQTTLTLAPNSTVVLDEYVFDPNSGEGRIGLQLTRGAMRFMGGTLSNREPANISTPTASIGIRGSSALILYRDGQTLAIFVAGEQMCVAASGQRNCTSRQGGVVGENGYLGQVSPEFLALILGLIDGRPAPAGVTSNSPGTGTERAANSGPFSTTGQQIDTDIFGDDFNLVGLLSDLGVEVEIIEDSDPDPDPDPCVINPRLCYDPDIIILPFVQD